MRYFGTLCPQMGVLMLKPLVLPTAAIAFAMLCYAAHDDVSTAMG
jgi:hypothetical protein